MTPSSIKESMISRILLRERPRAEAASGKLTLYTSQPDKMWIRAVPGYAAHGLALGQTVPTILSWLAADAPSSG